MHGRGRDYSPGGIYEGRPGSAKVLTFHNVEKQKSFTGVTVFQPLPKGQAPLPVKFTANAVQVGNETYQFKQDEISVAGDVFELWR
jgi:hypothetical protein